MSISTIRLAGGARRLPSLTLKSVMGAMDRDGAVAFDGLFPLGLLKRLRASVLRRHAGGGLRRNGLVRDIGGRYAAVLPFDGPFLEPAFYAAPALACALEALLGADYCIGSLETVISVPGAYRQHVHIDAPIRFDRTVAGRRVPYRGDLTRLPPYAVSLYVPLCDIDEENGPTALWAGSHRAALSPDPPSDSRLRRDYRVEYMSGKLGRAYLFDYRAFHCGMPNHSREARPLLIMVFTRPWFRDPNRTETYPELVISKRALARVPERHRGLFMLAPAARKPLWR